MALWAVALEIEIDDAIVLAISENVAPGILGPEDDGVGNGPGKDRGATRHARGPAEGVVRLIAEIENEIGAVGGRVNEKAAPFLSHTIGDRGEEPIGPDIPNVHRFAVADVVGDFTQ